MDDDVKGTINPGKYADLVVLSNDPITIPCNSIKNLEVEMTIIGGEIVYQRGK